MDSPSEGQLEKNPPGCKAAVRKLLLTLAIFVASLVLLILCCVIAKVPPQIFGNNQDHFRAHVINPIPDSVEILNVAFDDLIIHPDVTYYFRFHINRNDLEKIISYRSLTPGEGNCDEGSYPPEWWNVGNFDNVEKYIYEEGQFGSLLITLCYHVPSKTAYYMFFTY